MEFTTFIVPNNVKKPHEVPDLPWEKVKVDLFVMDRQSFLIAVDYYSGYFEVQDLSSMTSICVITVLKSWFSRHGIPSTAISDNETPFNSEDFKSQCTGKSSKRRPQSKT